MNLYLDIETIPAQDPAIHAMIAERVKAPATHKKPETIAKWEAEEKPAAVAKAIADTSFDGGFGEVCCIGWAVGNRKVRSATVKDGFDETDALMAFFNSVEAEFAKEDTHAIPGYWSATIVGHNVASFDIRFIWQRAIVLGVRVPSWFPRDPKPWGNEVFDTMAAFAGAKGSISLDRLCRILGIAGKDGFDGSMVAKAWADGEHEKIAAYCRDDVERVRQVHRRMMVAYGQEAA